MNLTSFLANKCFEYLLNSEAGKARGNRIASLSEASTPAPSQPPILPPWAPEKRLLHLNCDSCGSCIASCENNILVQGEDGFPQVDFSKGSCTFCGNCARSCQSNVFDYEASGQPWNLKAFIANDCLSSNNVLCRICSEHCEEDAIVISKTSGTISVPRIDKEKCNGCGACYGPCPAEAIYIISPAGSEKL